jgi:hypothetical protein
MNDPGPLRRRPQIPSTDQAIAAIREHLQKMRFGSIALTIHDGEVVQLDITEKRRLFAR